MLFVFSQKAGNRSISRYLAANWESHRVAILILCITLQNKTAVAATILRESMTNFTDRRLLLVSGRWNGKKFEFKIGEFIKAICALDEKKKALLFSPGAWIE